MSAARPKTRRQAELPLSLSKRCRPRISPAARLILPFAITRRRAATYTFPSWGYSAGAVYRRIGTEARDWVTYPEEQGHFPMPRWVEQHVRETGASVAFRASDMPMHLTAIRAGAGRGILPCFIADEDPLLERVVQNNPQRIEDVAREESTRCGQSAARSRRSGPGGELEL